MLHAELVITSHSTKPLFENDWPYNKNYNTVRQSASYAYLFTLKPINVQYSFVIVV